MPELPEVEVLREHLNQHLPGCLVKAVHVLSSRIIRPHESEWFSQVLVGRRFVSVGRRGKFLQLELKAGRRLEEKKLIVHLGMTGRFYLAKKRHEVSHERVVFRLDRGWLVFRDVRQFGRITFEESSLHAMGPEPLSDGFELASFVHSMRCSKQSLKVRLMDQRVVAGVGNIYASEALHQARLSPFAPCSSLSHRQIERLWRSIRKVLQEAVDLGLSLNLDWSQGSDGLFYFGSTRKARNPDLERFKVYGREAQSCYTCGHLIERVSQAGRSSFYCSRCQRVKAKSLDG